MIEITLPWPDKRLNPNSRNKWAKIKAKEDARNESWWCAFESSMGFSAKYRAKKDEIYEARYTFCPPDRRHRDIDNCLAMMKTA